jgi:putative sterol carrier protein
MLIDEADPVVMDPLDFARVVKQTPADELQRVMTGDRRAAILDELVRRMPDVFRVDKAAGISAVVHWRVGGRADSGFDTYELTIENGVCSVSDGPVREPRLVLTIGGVDFLRMATGNAHPVSLVMRGKLKSKGDMALTAKFPNLFDTPRP